LQTPDLETGGCSAIINVSHRQTHELFTLAIHHPELLEEVREFVRWNHDLLLDNDTSKPTSSRRALLITFKVDRKALCVAFAAIGLLSGGGGLAAGLVLRRMDLGIAISSLFAAILSIIEVLLVWFQAS
jgi:hypothetical protein